MSEISKLPAPTTAPPMLSSGTVQFYRDASWSGMSYAITTQNYIQKKHHLISGSLHDESTWIAFNLPVGTVMTMMAEYCPTPPETENPNTLASCGRVADLVGTGKTEAVDLTKINLNDCISGFFWRTLDLNAGGIELYESAGFAGNRTVLFLSEWPTNTVCPLDGWYIKDRASSVRWNSLVDAQMAFLYDSNAGVGFGYENIKAWGSFKEVSNLKDVSLNDKLSSFKWNNVEPKEEYITPVPVVVPNDNGPALSNTWKTYNNSPETQHGSVKVNCTEEQSTTVEVTNQYTAGMALSYSLSAVKDKGTNEVTSEWSLAIHFSYTHSDTTSMTKTQTNSLEIENSVTAPAYHDFKATLWVQLGKVPPGTTYRTTADRWYDVQLNGSTYDASKNLWFRKENVTLQLGGTLAVSQNLVIDSVKIPGSPAVPLATAS